MRRRPNPPDIWIHELPLESQRKVISLALLVVADLAAGRDWSALEKKQFANLTLEEELGFWSLLDSTQRTAIKSMESAL